MSFLDNVGTIQIIALYASLFFIWPIVKGVFYILSQLVKGDV